MVPNTQNSQPRTVGQSGTPPASAAFKGDPSNAAEFPVRFQRFPIVGELGKGAYGVVYKAFDEILRRHVAIKVPYLERISSPEDLDLYLAEARTLASLRHRYIVVVHDAVPTEDGRCFGIVSELIEGGNLFERMRQSRPPVEESVSIVSHVAVALHYAHQQGFVHRDIKPGNILLKADGDPVIVDFGLALREEDFGKGPVRTGTASYMSPEQARGESHRVDGRSDIFSLGIVLYELLTGQRPFSGSDHAEILERIQNQEPRPPRQLDNTIPRELDRICLKALAKRASDRYSTALDLVEDLNEWSKKRQDQPVPVAVVQPVSAASVLPSQPTCAVPSDTERRPLMIVPKGLRSFEAEDADFFLELLPGARDRDRVPQSIRFWQKRIESIDPQRTFSVGLLYGPSGCGKSSLVKAGLLPRLAPHVIAVHVEAAPEATEHRLLHVLRRHCPQLPAETGLAKALTLLRRGRGQGPGEKILIVLDQFEQWLHGRCEGQPSELIQALRQCDGEHVQALVMVRDDFWMATTRFMSELEVPLVEGQNSAAVDLFDQRHARKVLTAFGRADGALPAEELTRAQQEFVEQAVEGLAQEGTIIPVRLGLFAQMVRSEPWLPATLKKVGGTVGVGVAFLEQTFSGPTAPPAHRRHQHAARAVLRLLLPEQGTDIKGHMRSYRELAAASGYTAGSREFEDLLRILDSEVRLITPADPEGTFGREPAAGADSALAEGSRLNERHYQLTHDYLVPSLRDWLTRKQKETWRGRAELRLAERAAEWTPHRERRLLPTAPEYLWLACGVPNAKRKPSERKLLRAAAGRHGLRWGIGLAVVLIAGLLLQQYFASVSRKTQQEKAESLVNVVADAAPQGVPTAIERLQPMREVCLPLLRGRFDETSADSSERLHLGFALAALGDIREEFLVKRIAHLSVYEANNMMTALSFGKPTLPTMLLQRIDDEKDPELRARFAIMLLHLGDSRGAERTLDLGEDPTCRTAFIHSFAAWHGDLEVLPKLLNRSTDPAFQSGICAALGLTDKTSLAADVRDSLVNTCEQLFLVSPDASVHGAAGWALRQWKEGEMALGSLRSGTVRSGWFVNKCGMTMVLVPIEQTEFTMGDTRLADCQAHAVKLTRPLYLCDREVTIDLFKRFLEDPDPTLSKPTHWKNPINWQNPNMQSRPSGDTAMSEVSWLDALLFCNWLSLRECRSLCYHRAATIPGTTDDEGGRWSCSFEANGYRLPTEAEWEYACRAATTSLFSFGDDDKLLINYGYFNGNSEMHPWPGGTKLPNAWGFFDMHGNVQEWCWDRYSRFTAAEIVSDPHGPLIGDRHVARGGDSFLGAQFAFSASRMAVNPTIRQPSFGFRVACGATAKD